MLQKINIVNQRFDELIQFYVIFEGDIWKPNIWIGEGRYFPLGNFYFNILIPIFDKAYLLHVIIFCQTLILVFILFYFLYIIKDILAYPMTFKPEYW